MTRALELLMWLALIAWITVMPSIGVLYLLGWMK